VVDTLPAFTRTDGDDEVDDYDGPSEDLPRIELRVFDVVLLHVAPL